MPSAAAFQFYSAAVVFGEGARYQSGEAPQEDEALHHRYGVMVKNTFLDIAPLIANDAASAITRSRSAPPGGGAHEEAAAEPVPRCGAEQPAARRFRSGGGNDTGIDSTEPTCPAGVPMRGAGRGVAAIELQTQTESHSISSPPPVALPIAISHPTPEGTDVASPSFRELAGDGQGSSAVVAQLIVKECGFLRIKDVKIGSPRRKSLPENMRVRIFVEGLPWTKRSKWLQPLLWTVATLLRRAGQQTRVHHGELRVALPDGSTVCAELVAGRA